MFWECISRNLTDSVEKHKFRGSAHFRGKTTNSVARLKTVVPSNIHLNGLISQNMFSFHNNTWHTVPHTQSCHFAAWTQFESASICKF